MFRTGKAERARLDRAAAGHEPEPKPRRANYGVDEVGEKEEKKGDAGAPEPKPTLTVDPRPDEQKWWEDPVPNGDSCPGTTGTNLNIGRDGTVNNDNRMRPCSRHG